MEESQQRLLEGIQLHHQGELERLLTDRDQLLEEETAAAVMGKDTRRQREGELLSYVSKDV